MSTSRLRLSASAISHQLRLLRSLRPVTYRKEGQLAYCSLDDDHTAQLLQDVLSYVQGRFKHDTFQITTEE